MNQHGSSTNGFFHGTVFYNFLFIIFQLMYNYVFRGLLLDESIGTVYGAGNTPLLGIMVLLVIFAGTYAILIKCRELRISGVKSAGVTGFIIWVMNWVLVTVMVLTAMKSFGIDISKRTDAMSDLENTLIICSLLGAMLQAGTVIGFLVRLAEPYEKTVSRLEKISADIFAFMFLCVSYTVVWETIMYRSVEVHGRYDILTGYGLLGITGWILSFIMLYPPMRFPFMLQEIQDYKQDRGRLWIALSYGAVILTGIIPLIKTS